MPARSTAIWGTFPGSRRHFPYEGAGRDLVRRIRHRNFTMGVETMSSKARASQPPRRTRHQARDALAVMAFSAAASVGLTAVLILLIRVSR